MRLYLDPAALRRIADENHERYATAQPFPHAYFDGLLPDDALDLALAAFPDPDCPVWKEYENYHEVKLETQGEERLPPEISLLLYQFNSAPFLQFLEHLSGIEGLIPDPYFSGGGLHQIVRGGKLGVHADFSRHTTLPLHRRINVIIFLNRDWKEEYGGHLELWNRDATQCCERILPVFNRTAIFSTTDWSYHGHPEPLECPEGMTRKSIALYYFTVERPEGETIDGKESTLFVQRPGEVVPQGTKLERGESYTGLKADRFMPTSGRARAIHALRRITPPVLFDAAVHARRRAR
ncbi:MAG: 2OG-Fe(II) oxygenase [Acidimicrobiia bacterium]|jgi:hypothetical protein